MLRGRRRVNELQMSAKRKSFGWREIANDKTRLGMLPGCQRHGYVTSGVVCEAGGGGGLINGEFVFDADT
jgi:hypothetical protein